MLLAKISASTDVAVGFPIAGRGDPALDELIGFFVNTLVLRVELSGDPTAAELLAQVRQRSLAAYEHQHVPFEVLVERLNPTRSLAHHPLVQVVLAWQNFAEQGAEQGTDPGIGMAFGDLRATSVPIEARTARMDLVFSLSERFTEAGEPAGIGGAVEFRTDVFDAATIEALIERLQRVLAALTADPTRRLSSIDVLGTGEQARLDELGNQMVLTQPPAGLVSIPAVFAAHVQRTPEAVAVTFEGHSMTYRELDEAANRLAHLLADQGAASGAVCGASAFAVGRGDRGDVGGAQNRGGLPADRPGAAGGPDRVHAHRCRAHRRDHHDGAALGAGRARPGGHRYPRPPNPGLPMHRLADAGPRGYRLHHLHLRHHRST